VDGESALDRKGTGLLGFPAPMVVVGNPRSIRQLRGKGAAGYREQ